MKLLVACEYSGVVRRAFRALGHDAWSCDLLPAEDGSEHHIQGDAIEAAERTICVGGMWLEPEWDMMIAHPPCTDLAVSGARWFPAKRASGAQDRAVRFFMALVNARIRHIAVENPVSIMSSLHRKPDQIIQPWQYGHGETKATCLWLKNLPKLTPTNIVEGREARVHKMAPGPDRWKERSRTYEGIAAAMAAQWGGNG